MTRTELMTILRAPLSPLLVLVAALAGCGDEGPACTPGSTRACYGGPAGTEGVGQCQAGVETCLDDGSGYGACSGEVTPAAADTCAPGDENCDGFAPCTPPSLGAQIDRAGRPGMNLFANSTFEAAASTRDAARDAYNQDADPAGWDAHVAAFEATLAVWDGIDTICGNQLLADGAVMTPARYAELATMLADDRLYLKTDATECTTYLGVEANSIGATNADCGGNKVQYDAVDYTYTLVVTGGLDGSIGDGSILSNDAVPDTTFPYLLAPNP